MFDFLFSKEVLFLLSMALCVVGILSISAILIERKQRYKYRKPLEPRQR